MAKTSAVERNKKRERMVKQQAARRSRLRAGKRSQGCDVFRQRID